MPVRALHLGACPHLTRIPHRSLRTFRELNFKLLTAGGLTMFTAVHVSMMYLATPATLTTTQNPHRFYYRSSRCMLQHCAWTIYCSLKEYSSFLDRQKHTQQGIGAMGRRMRARLTQQDIAIGKDTISVTPPIATLVSPSLGLSNPHPRQPSDLRSTHTPTRRPSLPAGVTSIPRTYMRTTLRATPCRSCLVT